MQLEEYVHNLKDGINTILGGIGIKILEVKPKEFQSQFIIFYPEIIVLDEATSALFENTENEIIQNISRKFER